MRSFGSIFLLLLFSATTKAQTSFPQTPDSAIIYTADIPLFWKVFDETKPDFDPDKLKSGYLDAGSPGLKGFIFMRIESGKNLSKTIRADQSYYEHIRPTSLEIDKNRDVLKGYLQKMEALYPPCVFPGIYFVIGARNSGGTTFKNGLIVGAEMFGNASPGFTPRLPFSSVNLIVIHELVHFQQQYAKDNTLLGQSIREGAADFVCELVTGSHANQYFYGYGDAREKELWEEFKTKMDGTKWEGWLYGKPKEDGRPNDLGYWMGYKIVKAYYNKAADKKQAVADILNIKDMKAFLAASGYGQ